MLKMEPECSSETFATTYQTAWRLQSKGLKVFQNRALGRIFGPQEEVTSGRYTEIYTEKVLAFTK
jgi:hypothetical protein